MTESETVIAQPFLIHRATERATGNTFELGFDPFLQFVSEIGHVAPDMDSFKPESDPFLLSVLEIDHVTPDIRGRHTLQPLEVRLYPSGL